MLTTAPEIAPAHIITAADGFLDAALQFVIIHDPTPRVADHTGISLPGRLHHQALLHITPFLYGQTLRRIHGQNIDYRQLGADLYMAANQLDDAFTQPALIEHQQTLTAAAVAHGTVYLRQTDPTDLTSHEFLSDVPDYT